MKDPVEKSQPSLDSPDKSLQLRESLFSALDESKKSRSYHAVELGTAAGVTNATISFLRSQTKDVKLATFQRLVDAMPTDVALIFYRQLGNGLGDAINQSDAAPLRAITALLNGCNDSELMALAYQLGKLSAERQARGSEHASAFLAISQMINSCNLKDIPGLINLIGQYTEAAMKELPQLEQDVENKQL